MSNKRKLCFLIPTLEGGGAEKNLAVVINSLDPDSYEIYILCLLAKGVNMAKFDKAKVQIIDLNRPQVYFSIRTILKTVKKIKPDVIIGWMGFLNAYLAFFKFLFPRGFKWVCRESSIPGFQNKYFNYPGIISFLYRFMNNYDVIICQSIAMADDLADNFGVARKKLKIINNPGNFSDTLPVTSLKNQSTYNILYVGNMNREKRVHLLIEVLAKLPPSYNLTMLGQGSESKSIEEMIKSAGLEHRVEIRKDCFDPNPFYAASDCLLLCSNHEGFPNVLVEAMGEGCPAIGYNIKGGANEILSNYGGFIVSEDNIDTFARTIQQVCEEKEIDRPKVAATAHNLYSIKKILTEYEEAFN